MATLQGLAVALGIGVLIGIERGWHERESPEGSRVAGIRTFALIGLLGGVWALAGDILGQIVLGFAYAAFAAVMVIVRVRAAAYTKDYGATTLVAALLTFVLGALAVTGEIAVAVPAAVVATLLLGIKPALHGLLERIDYEELLAVLKLLVMSLVLLPILPNQGYGPWEALNPYQLWLMVVLISAISFAGYVAVRLLGRRKGIFMASLAGGLVSSTAVAVSFSRLSAKNPEQGRLLAGGITLASATMYVRTLVIVGVIERGLLPILALPLGLATAAGLVATLVIMGRSDDGYQAEALKLRNPFEFGMALKFGLLLGAIILLARAFREWLGDVGIYVVSALSGFADVDAVTLTVSDLLPDELAYPAGAVAIMLAAFANTLTKSGIAIANGGPSITRPVAIGLATPAVVGVAALSAELWLIFKGVT